MKFRKKPVEIEAILWTGDNYDETKSFMAGSSIEFDGDGHVFITTLEGIMCAGKGDWIIKGVKGEFYPCKAHIFEMTYEEVK